MNKSFCPNCGNEVPAGASFCGSCGNSIGAQQSTQQSTQQFNSQYSGGPRPQVAKKDIIVTIILSIVTCGIYGIIWFINLTDDTNVVAQDTNSASGIVAFVLTIVTCGIYGIYWYYNLGKKLYIAGQKNGVPTQDNSLLYLILGLFGLGIVVYVLAQQELNNNYGA